MLVPRSFKYSSSPDSQKQRPSSRTKSKKSFVTPPASTSTTPPRPNTASHYSQPPPHAPWVLTPAMPSTLQPSRPVEIPSRRSPRDPRHFRSSRASSKSSRTSRNSETKHRPDALPPAVAALLAVTAIPPPKSQTRRKKSPVRDMSIDELIQEWRKDSSTKSSYSSASLDMLLGSADEDEYDHMYSSRSTSCDSIPSLDGDDGSVLSVSNPATPDSIRSRKSSMGSYRKEKTLYTPEIEDCSVDHPLGLSTLEFDEDLILINSPCPKERKQRKSGGFRSNLSSSLQALKSRVTSSFSSLNLNLDEDSFSDASLWQHPYLFPRLSSELRPTPFTSTPSKSQRQYLNPRSAPVPFEEQQHHWQEALSSLDSPDEFSEAPMIQMQTYNKRAASQPRRTRRGSSTGTPDSRSEAGRAMSGHVPMPSRQREPRENSDFLRVIVLEMNMRRGGKFDEGASGRAKIWLPPRKQPVARNSAFSDDEDEDEIVSVSGSRVTSRKIPRRWVPVSIE